MLLIIFIFLFAYFIGNEVYYEMPIPSNSTAFVEFDKWIHEKAYIAPMTIADCKDMDRGLIAKETIKENSTLMDIDLDYVICPETVLKSLSKEDKELFMQMDDELILTAFLIQERLKEEKSTWYLWFKTLPTNPIAPSSFSYDDIDLFEDPTIINRMHMQRQDYFSTYLAFTNHLSHYFFSLPGSFFDHCWCLHYKTFEWAFTIVNTRMITSSHYIIPFMDYRNYITTDSPYENIDRSPEKTHIVNTTSHHLIITTDKEVKQNRPVYINYELYPSHFYLLNYGFVPISNIHDCLLIPLPPPTTPSSLLDKVLDILDFPSDYTVCLDVTRFMNDKALAYFLLRDANSIHLQQCIDHYENEIKIKQGHWEIEDLHRCALGIWSDNTKELWDGVKDDLKKQLYNYLIQLQKQYTTNIAYDNYILHTQHDSLTYQQVLALKWRVSRKHLLQLAINNLEVDHLNPEEEEQQQQEQQQQQELNEPVMNVNEWIKKNNDLVKVSVTSTPWNGYGLIAKEEISKGDEILVLRNDTIINLEHVFKHPLFGSIFESYYHDGMKSELLLTIYEKYENGKWSDFAPFLSLLPPLRTYEQPVLLSEKDILQLYGSCLYDDIKALNSSLHTYYTLCHNMIHVNPTLKKAFSKKSVFTYSHFIWSYLFLKSKGVYLNGELTLIPVFAFAQNSIYQNYEDYLFLDSNRTHLIYTLSESMKFTSDVVIKQGYANWYMLLYKGELLMAEQQDCIRWNLQLAYSDPSFDYKYQQLRKADYHTYEQFCLQPKADLIPAKFIEIASILHNVTISNKKERQRFLIELIKDKESKYITMLLSDKMRSRRGQYSNKLQLMNRFLSSERRLLKELKKSVYRMNVTNIME